jgi:hypothetical protein
VHFYDLSEADAAAFCDHVTASHDAKLQEFAKALLATSGSLAALDGGVESLIPLWQWTLTQVENEFASIPFDGPSDGDKALRRTASPYLQRLSLVDEWIGHYVFEIVRNGDARAAWTVHPRAGKGPEFSAALECVIHAFDRFITVRQVFSSAMRRASERKARALESDALKGLVKRHFLFDISPSGSGQSLLLPLLSAPEARLSPPVLRSAVVKVRDKVAAETVRPFIDGILFSIASGIRTIADLETAQPMDVVSVSEELLRLNFEPALPDTRAMVTLVRSATQFQSPDAWLNIEPYWNRAELRALECRILTDDFADWSSARSVIESLANRLGARVLVDDATLTD